MKKTLYLTMVLVMLAITATMARAQDATNVDNLFFIVYHNGGQISPFFASEVDSIGYSRFDADSVEYSDWYSQVVYTPDNAYFFPLEQVDSVGFQERPTVYQSDVVMMQSDWEQHVVSYEENIITFATGITSVWTPNKGDVLLYQAFTDRFPNGYVGRVTDVSTASDGSYRLTMGDIGLDDIYRQAMIVARVNCLDTYEFPEDVDNSGEEEFKAVSRKIMRRSPGVTIPVEIGGAGMISSKVVQGNVFAKVNMFLTVALYKSPGGSWNFWFKNVPVAQFGAAVKAETDSTLVYEYNPDALIPLIKGKKPVTIPIHIGNLPLMMFVARLGPYMYQSGKISMKFEWSKSVSLPIDEIFFANGEWHHNRYEKKNSQKSNFQFRPELDVDCETMVGIVMTGVLSSNNIYGRIPYLEAGLTLKSGVTIGGNVNVKFDQDNVYDMLKDSKLSVGFKTIGSFDARIFLNTKEPEHKFKLAEAKVSTNFWEAKLFPDFDDIVIDKPKEGIGPIKASTSALGFLMFEQEVGLGLFDHDDNVVTRVTMNDKLGALYENNQKLSAYFSGLKPAEEYTIKPYIKLWDWYIDAKPSATVKLDLKLETWSANAVKAKTATLRGYCDAIEGSDLVKVGFVYSNSPSATMDLKSGKWVESATHTNGAFSVAISGLEPGTTYGYRACLMLEGEVYYGELQEFTTEELPGEAVDLGLSVLWADRNVGAMLPHQHGGLFGWADPTGEITTADVMTPTGTWDSDLYGGKNPPADISGSSFDIARARWKDNWRMPTEAEIAEIVSLCEWIWTEIEGTPGYRVIGPNGNSIFLPVTGYRFDSTVYDAGCGYYWSGSLDTSRRNNAFRIDFNAGDWDYTSYARYAGQAVRPVIDNQPEQTN